MSALPEIIAVVEAEDRPSLLRFNDELLDKKDRHIMLVDGNDERGIDVGLMTKSGFPIRNIRSNVDAEDSKGIVFSRDCPEYQVITPNGTELYLLVNHFKKPVRWRRSEAEAASQRGEEHRRPTSG